MKAVKCRDVEQLHDHPLWSYDSPLVDRIAFRQLVTFKMVELSLRNSSLDIFDFFINQSDFDFSFHTQEIIIIACLKNNIKAVEILLNQGIQLDIDDYI